METVIAIIGIIILLIGVVYLIKPELLKQIMEFFKKGNRLYLGGVLRFALAVVFLLGARECGLPWVIVIFAILFLIGGVLVFVLGPNKIRPILDWWQKQSLWLIRLVALIVTAVGAVIIYSASGQ